MGYCLKKRTHPWFQSLGENTLDKGSNLYTPDYGSILFKTHNGILIPLYILTKKKTQETDSCVCEDLCVSLYPFPRPWFGDSELASPFFRHIMG